MRTAATPITRRRLLEAGFATAAAGALLRSPTSVLAATRSPRQARDGAAAWKIDPRRFPPADLLKTWQRELDELGLRATGTRVHERYIDTLHERLQRAGVKDVHAEGVPFERWTTRDWKLEIIGGSSAGPVRTASYIPYTGHTPTAGVSGPLVVLDPDNPPGPGSLKGKIAIFDIPNVTLPWSYFLAIGYEGKTYDPQGIFSDPNGVYSRSWLGIEGIIDLIEQAGRAQARGVIGVLDLPADAAHGAYYPYDGTIRDVPGVYVDRKVGARLKQLAGSGTRARLTVPSKTVKTKSRNLIGFIPGASRELMILHSHTDGPNGVEDDGPDSIVAACRYLTSRSRDRLPRTVLVLLTTGHFIGAKGVESFVTRHKEDLLRRAAAAVTLEHLGAEEWNPGPDGHSHLTGNHEPGTFFTPENRALVGRSFRALKRAKDAPSSVLRPYVPARGSPDGHGWPAEGTGLWTQGALPTTNYITGPTYLLNWGIRTTDKYNARLARRETIAFTELLLRLSTVPRSQLRALDLLPTS